MTDQKIRKDLYANYENYYAGDSEWRKIGAKSKVDNIVNLCKDIPNNSVIEIGAGEGAIIKGLSELNFGRRLYALEVSPTGLKSIKYKKIPRLVNCVLFDGYHTPFVDNYFDIAILSHVIEHVEYPRQLIYEASRIAQFLLVEVPLEDNIRLSYNYQFDSVGHINFYSPKTIRRLLQTCNLKVLKQTITNLPKAAYIYRNGKIGSFTFYIKDILVRLFPKIATELFTYHTTLLSKSPDNC